MDLPTVSVVMPSRLRERYLRDHIPKLLEDLTLTELIVVIDGPGDDSFSYLTGLRVHNERIKPLLLDKNLGRAAACQLGIDQATSDVVLLLDDDVTPCPNLVTKHARHHEQQHHEQWDQPGRERAGLLVIGYMPVEPVRRKFTTQLYAQEYESHCARYRSQPETILEHLWGGNISLRRDDLLRIGYVSTGFESLYHHDQDFGLRARSAGLTGVFDPQLRGIHLHSRSCSAFLKDAYSQGASRVLLAERHPSSMAARQTPSHVIDGIAGELPLFLRGLLRLGRYRCLEWLLSVITSPLLHSNGRLQIATGKFRRKLAQQRGALDMMDMMVTCEFR